MNYEDYLEKVKTSGYELENVPDSLKTPELCLAAVEQDGKALKYVPEALQTEALCQTAVLRDIQLTLHNYLQEIQRSGYALKYVSEALKTEELCLSAVRNFGRALEFVPDYLKTPEMCLEAVKHNVPIDEGVSALAFVPEKYKTPEICMEAIKHDTLDVVFWEHGIGVEPDYAAAINFVPKELRTPRLCFEALRNNPYSYPGHFNFIEEDSMNAGFVDLTLWEVEPKTLSEVLDSPDLFLKALEQTGMPPEYREQALRERETIKRGTL